MKMDVRPSVRAFALQMEAKLRQNEHKGGWTPNPDWTFHNAYQYLKNETTELREELANIHHNYGGVPCGCRYAGCPHALGQTSPEVAQAITKEAADVGNLAMMISDMVNGMPYGPSGMDEVPPNHYAIIGHYSGKQMGCCTNEGIEDVKEEEPLAQIVPMPKSECPVCKGMNGG